MMNSRPPSPLHLALTGYPLGHSLSPRLHTAALQALDLEGDYRLYPAPPLPEGAGMLGELLDRVRRGDLHGLNVTIPHKQSVLPRLDRLTPVAEAVRAVNTIYLHEGLLIGDNTDAGGFWADLQRAAASVLPANPSESRQPPSALVLGAGGSARAVAYALMMAGWWVYVAARRIEQAQELCAALSGAAEKRPSPLEEGIDHVSGLEASAGSRVDAEDRLKPRVQSSGRLQPIGLDASSISSLRLYSTAQSPISIIVNTTPLGMSPHIESSPWPQGTPFPPQAAVYDLVYNPLETALMRSSRQAGLPAFSGLGMLAEQAALAFERWTGLEAPREAMRRSVNLSEYPERT